MQIMNRDFNIRFWFGIAILILLGLGIIIFGNWVNDPTLIIITSNIGLALIVSGTYGAINEVLLKDKLVEIILSKINLKESIDKTGIESVHFGICEIDYRYYFRKAKKNIDIIHIYGRTWTNNNIEELTNKLSSSNCKIRVILLSPNSLFVPALAKYYNITEDELRARIDEVTRLWKEAFRRGTNKRNQASLKLYYHDGQPSNSLYRIDERIVFVQSKLTKGKTQQLPSIICTDTDKQQDLYGIYVGEIEALVKESVEVDLS